VAAEHGTANASAVSAATVIGVIVFDFMLLLEWLFLVQMPFGTGLTQGLSERGYFWKSYSLSQPVHFRIGLVFP